MLYGSTGKPPRPLSDEEKATKEKAERRSHRMDIILAAVGYTLLLPILIPVGIVMLLYLLVCKIIETVKNLKQNGWKLHSKQGEEKPYTEPRLISHTIIECSREMPVLFNNHYVVYVETGYNKKLNRFICRNLDYIRKRFSERHFHFVYIPELKNLTDEELSLAFPLDAAMMTNEAKNKIRSLSTAEFTRLFAKVSGMDFSGRMSGLLRLGSYEGDWGIYWDDVDYSKSDFVYVDLQKVDADSIKDAFEQYFRFYCGEKHGLFCIGARDEYPLDEWQYCESNGTQRNASDLIFINEQEDMDRIAEDIKTESRILETGWIHRTAAPYAWGRHS